MERPLTEEERVLGLINRSIEGRNNYVKLADVVAAARKDSFTTYLRVRGLEGPSPPLPNDWYNSHDCQWLRTRGYLVRKGYATLLIYITVAHFVEYLELLPNRDKAIDWRALTVTDARILAARLCKDLGIRPRNMGAYIHSIARSTHEARMDLKTYGGKKLIKPPPWCVFKEAWDKVLAEEREQHYTKQAKRQGSTGKKIPGVPAYGARNSQHRAPRRKRKGEEEEEPSTVVSPPLSPQGTPAEEEEEVVSSSSSSQESGSHTLAQKRLMHKWLNNPLVIEEPAKKKKKKITKKVVEPVVVSEEEDESVDW